MNFISRLVLWTVAVTSFSMGGLSPHSPDSSLTPAGALERFKSLSGRWVGTNSSGDRVVISYEVVANGTAVLERLAMKGRPNHEMDMVTLYYLDQGKLRLTHYCAVGNQPIMEARHISPQEISFELVGVNNLSTPDAGRMRRAVFQFKGPSALQSSWTWNEKGSDAFTEVVQIERAQQGTPGSF